jgi:hypothetical protein
MFETLPLHGIQLVLYSVNHIQTHTVMQEDDAVIEITQNSELTKCHALETLKHPAYSLDFLSCHFHIFGPINKALSGCTFTADNDVQ